MIAFPNAKINLGLNVVNRRADGYHDIETVMLPIGWCDILEITRASQNPDGFPALHTSGHAVDCEPEKNLVVKALRAMERHTGRTLGVETYLHKNIPDGAGLGGGSADAAFMLRLLNSEFNLEMKPDELERIAETIGSDCPFFIRNTPALATCRGEVLTPIETPLKGWHVVVVKPQVKISTAQAYGAISPKRPAVPLAHAIARPVDEWRHTVVNDFEAVAFSFHPWLADLKQRFYAAGAEYASMSGSGSAFYGLFKPGTDKMTERHEEINRENMLSYSGQL